MGLSQSWVRYLCGVEDRILSYHTHKGQRQMEGPHIIENSSPTKDWRTTLHSLVVSGQNGEQGSICNPSIDSFQVLAILAAVFYHSHFPADLRQLADGNFFVLLNSYLVWWVGVPYFFITAGYFFQRSIQAQGNPTAQLRRYIAPLVGLLLAWLCIYTVTPPEWPAQILHHGLWHPFYTEALTNIQVLETQHVWLFLDGTRPVGPLWFFPALITGLTILTLVALGNLQRYLAFLALAFYVLILVEEGTARNVLNAPLPLGPLLILAIPLVAVGGWLAERGGQFSASVAWSFIVGGYALALLEGVVIHMVFHGSVKAIDHHVYLGGICLSLGLFLLALAKPQLGRSTPFPYLGQLSLGIYVAHVFVMYTITPFVWKLADKVPMWGLFLGIIVYLASVIFVLVLARIPVIRLLVVKPAWERDNTAIQERETINKAYQSGTGR